MKIVGSYSTYHDPFTVEPGSLAAFLRASSEFDLNDIQLADLISTRSVAAVNGAVAMIAAMTRVKLKNPAPMYGTVTTAQMARAGRRVFKDEVGILQVRVAAALMNIERYPDTSTRLGLDSAELIYWTDFYHTPSSHSPGQPWCPPPGINRFDAGYSSLAKAFAKSLTA